MKKLTTIAVAAALVAPMSAMAETTVYGLVDNAVISLDNGSGSHLDVAGGNGTSRFGVKGSEDLGNGMKAIFQYEWQVQSTEGGSTTGFGAALSNRVAMVGLSGGFGTVALGRQWGPYYGAVEMTNIMNAPNQGTFHLTQAPSRTGNALGYASPNFGGFSFGAAVVMDQDSTAADDEDGVEQVHVSAKYSNGPITVGAGYIEAENLTGAGEAEQWGIGAKFKSDMFAVMGDYEETESAAGAETETLNLAGEAYFGNNTVKLQWTDRDAAGVDSDAWQIGLQHSFSKRTRVYVEYADLDAATDQDQFAVGLRHDF